MLMVIIMIVLFNDDENYYNCHFCLIIIIIINFYYYRLQLLHANRISGVWLMTEMNSKLQYYLSTSLLPLSCFYQYFRS